MNKKILYLFAFASGFTLMSLEMVTFRVLAPFFGTSMFIWSLIIGIVMVLIFTGNIIGGILSKKYEEYKLFAIMASASILIAFLSQSTILFLEYIYSTKLINNMIFFISLMILSSLLISLPILFIAMSSPWLIKIVSKDLDLESVGIVSGRIYGINTMGGLLGTFIPSIILVPLIGSKLTIFFTSIVLFSVSILGVLYLRRKNLSIILVILFLFSSILYFVPSKSYKGVVEKKESLYNMIWIEKKDKDVIDLKVNERKAVQSRLYLNKKSLVYDVWHLYMSAPFFNKNKTEPKILFLGLGGGSTAYYYKKYYPKYKLTGVEIDGEIVKLGKKYFKLNETNTEIHIKDARVFLSQTEKKYDVIIVDTFKFPYIPEHLSTLEFVQLISKRLNKGGVALFNIGRFEKSTEIVDMMAQTSLRVFKNIYEYKVINGSNTFLYLMNHDKDKYLSDNTLNFQLKSLKRNINNNMKPIKRDKSIAISTDNKPLTEMLTNLIILKNLGKVF